MLGQTALLLREAYKIINKANKLSGSDRDKLMIVAKDKLMKANEKEDLLQPTVLSVLAKYGMIDEIPSTPTSSPTETQSPGNPE